MKKVRNLIIAVSLIILSVCMFGACELTYGEPDSLHIGEASFGEKLSIGLQVSLLGVGTVFLVLALLILFVNVLKYVFQFIGKPKASKKTKKVEDEPVIVDAPVDEASEDDEIVAVITAALMAYYDAQAATTYKSNVKFKVRSIKEIK
jgi:sodium pump decarboxylase gamma subunit